MKKLLYIASICIASLFSACDDYLTVESPDQLTSSSFWRNQSDAEAGIAAASTAPDAATRMTLPS